MTDIDRRNLLQMTGAALMAGLAGCGAGVFGDGTIPNSGDDESTNESKEPREDGGSQNFEDGTFSEPDNESDSS